MKKNFVLVTFLGFCLIFFASGCVTTPRNQDSVSKTSNLLEPSTALKFSDVPVPSGFKMIPQNSYSFECQGVRVGVLKYQGKADIEQVVNFYKEQMAMYGWDLLNVVEYGERIMNFERENETCIINLLPKGNNITITISLGPRSQTTKKSKQSLK